MAGEFRFLPPWKAVGGDGRGSFGIATDAVLGSRCTSKLHTGDANRSATSQPAKWEWQKRMMTLGNGKGNWWNIEISVFRMISLEDVQKQARQPNFILFNNLMSRLLHSWIWESRWKSWGQKNWWRKFALAVLDVALLMIGDLICQWPLETCPKALGSTCTWNLKSFLRFVVSDFSKEGLHLTILVV